MRIALIGPYADPEKGAAVVRINSFRESFSAAGHEVLILAPARGVAAAAGVTRYRGILHLLSLLRRARPDVILGTSPPITHNAFVAVQCAMTRTPFVLDAKDPFSYLVARFAHLRKGRFKTAGYKACEWIAHRLAAHIFVLTPLDKKNLLACYGLPAEKVTVIRNGSDPRVIRPLPAAGRTVRAALKVPPSAKILVYAGVIGGKDLDVMLDALASLLAKKAYLLFLFTHDGSAHADRMHAHVREAVARLSLEKRVRVVVNTPYEKLAASLSAADLALSPVPDFWLSNLPTKVFDYLAADLPVVAKGPRGGSMDEFFRTYDVGTFSTTWEGFAAGVERELAHPHRRVRRVIERHFSRPILNRRALKVLEGLA
ncbi:MAG: glycosyltransferase [Candidatus Aenigmarchaeota archaeon]|nr:glycosyltransferase [Candidatus Aenigmarchaeota archaeon]